MIRAILYKDFKALRAKSRSFVLMAVMGVICIGSMAWNLTEDGYARFGVDFVQLLFISLFSFATFLEFYISLLFDDKRDGILALLILSGKSRAVYFLAKVIIPFVITSVFSVVSVICFLLFVSTQGFSLSTLLFLVTIIMSELFLTMGLGMLLTVLSSADDGAKPAIVWPVLLANCPLLYFVNPISNFPLFCALTVSIGFIAYIASWLVLPNLYRNNVL